ncbi:MAG: adenine nucleotide alpha hydrolase [Acidimicrobiales bacterium]|nr:MAG: adenine nucleotide alpha hydrolase [Acidimicrobiales bacterium]
MSPHETPGAFGGRPQDVLVSAPEGGTLLVGEPDTASLIRALEERLRALHKVVVAFSGGVDSGLLAHVAVCALGSERVLAVTAVSPAVPAEEVEHCRMLAAEWGMRWCTVSTDELTREEYVRNDPLRCYHCKQALMDALEPLAEREGATVVLGVNLDDLDDHRPGQVAARERGAVFPLVEAGFTKSAVRRCARALGLSIWDKPAAPCLASRLPYGTTVSVELLDRVGRAERALRALGFSDVRVRHHGDIARIEVPLRDLGRLLECRERVVEGLRAAGYRYVTADLEGLRSGNLNERAAVDILSRGGAE